MGVRARLARQPATVAYVGAVCSVAAAGALLGPERHERLARGASTDLDHLSRRPLLVLPASAFVLERPLHGVLLPSLALTMAAVERRRGTAGTLAVFAAGHVGATLLVAGGLLGGIRTGVVDESWRRAMDVGVSYGELALAAAAVDDLPPGQRSRVATAVTAVLLGTWVVRRQPVDAGHLAAWAIGWGVVRSGGVRGRP